MMAGIVINIVLGIAILSMIVIPLIGFMMTRSRIWLPVGIFSLVVIGFLLAYLKGKLSVDVDQVLKVLIVTSGVLTAIGIVTKRRR
ncbi:hypothetical protein [Serratia bockelmannii]|uniref:hypothetical protein n=1 Tax=Serratia bockelmannii TaxID=2703793 RepID=UPI0011F3790E|nr:hypothetical protein [Serratia bockelmannii]